MPHPSHFFNRPNIFGRADYNYEAPRYVIFSTLLLPSLEVGWLTLQLRIWEVPGSNLGPETVYPD
jgi:hypothetical protein